MLEMVTAVTLFRNCLLSCTDLNPWFFDAESKSRTVDVCACACFCFATSVGRMACCMVPSPAHSRGVIAGRTDTTRKVAPTAESCEPFRSLYAEPRCVRACGVVPRKQ